MRANEAGVTRFDSRRPKSDRLAGFPGEPFGQQLGRTGPKLAVFNYQHSFRLPPFDNGHRLTEKVCDLFPPFQCFGMILSFCAQLGSFGHKQPRTS